MGKILVLYDTRTGCTEKMAALIAEGCDGVPEMEGDVLWADALAVGTPTNLGGISWKMKKFWDDWAADNWNKVDGKIACTFSSQGGHGGGGELACTAMNIVLMNFGFLVFGVTDYVDKIHTLHYGVCVAKEPRNDYDIAACRRLGLRLAEWTAVFVDNKKELHPLLTTKKVDGREVEEADAKPPKATAAKSNKESETSVVPTATVPTAEGHEGPVHLIVRITVPVRNQTAWKLTVRELEKYSRQEPGCVRYHFGQIEGSETEFYVIEEYTSVEALNIHSNSPYFQALVPALGKMSSTLSVEKVFPINPQPIVAKSTGLDATTLVVGVCLGLGLGFAVNKLLSSN